MEHEIAQILVSMATPKRAAPPSPVQNQQKRQKNVLKEVDVSGEKTSRKNRSVARVTQYYDPKNPTLIDLDDRFSVNVYVPLGFESHFYQNRVNWKLNVVANPTDPTCCFVVTCTNPHQPHTSGPQRSVWTAYIRALETYHEAHPEEFLGKINLMYKTVDENNRKKPIVEVNARNIVGLYNEDVQAKIKDIFKIQ